MQIVAWGQESSGKGVMVERTSTSDFGGFAEPVTTLSEPRSIEEPAVAIDSSGRSVAAWRGFSLSFPGSFELRGSTTAFSNGAWASPSILEESGLTGSTQPGLALDTDGDATVGWNPAGSTIRAATRPAGGAFGPATTISSASHGGFGVPVVGADLGDALAAWPSSTGGTHIAMAIDDLTAPAVAASTPAPVLVGTPVSLSATATDAWGATLHWDFGDGESANGAAVSHTYTIAASPKPVPVTIALSGTAAGADPGTATVHATFRP